MKRFLSKKEIKDLIKKYPFVDWIKPKDKLWEEENIIYFQGRPYFIRVDDDYYPTLELILELYERGKEIPFPVVTVDKGATKFILNGADVMRPGIVEMDNFNKGDLVLVVDEEGNLLCLGRALYSKEEIEKMQKGKVIKNLVTWLS